MKYFVKKHHKRLTTEEADQICRITIVFHFFAVFFLFLFLIISASSGNFLHGRVMLGFVWLALANVTLFLLIGRMTPFILTSCFGYLIFCTYLQITGGESNTGILWHYVYPLMVYYIAGIHMGSFCAGLLILLEIFLFVFDDLFPFQTVYPMAFKIRFISTMIVMMIFGAMLEYSRWSSRRKLYHMAEKYHLASQTDDLTGLPNRRAFRALLQDQVVYLLRGEKKEFVVVIADVDYFKRINDRYGHAAGDAALKHLGGIFKRLLRKHDVVARWGGEEFMFLLPDTEMKEGKTVAERIRSEVAENPFLPEGGEEIYLTVSCGVGDWESHQDLDELIRVVDDRLYKAKEAGRNRVVWKD
jgi:diguanylate cyclase (GGDEF)-like protein